MQNFNFDNIVHTGNGDIYQCVDNGAPERPVEGDWNYPPIPTDLYRWDYRNSIIVSMSIKNNGSKTVKVSININKYDPTDLVTLDTTAPVIYKIEVPPGQVFVPIGGSHKVILEYADALNIEIYNASDVNDIVSTVSLMNIYDYGHIPPMWTLSWYGDIGLMTGGVSNANHVSEIQFASDTHVAHNDTPFTNGNSRASGSNHTIGLFAGGYSNTSAIESATFSSFAVSTGFGTLYDGTGKFSANSDTITLLMAGGYNNINTVQYNLFASGGAGAYWGALYNNIGTTQMWSVGNKQYSLWGGGPLTSIQAIAQYTEYATQAQCQLWGNLFIHRLGAGAGAAIETHGLSYGDDYSSTSVSYKYVHRWDFASQGDSTNWGSIGTTYSMKFCGSVANGEKVLFGADDYYNDNLYEVSYATEAGTNFWGDIQYFNGGQPTGCSGG